MLFVCKGWKKLYGGEYTDLSLCDAPISGTLIVSWTASSFLVVTVSSSPAKKYTATLESYQPIHSASPFILISLDLNSLSADMA